MYRTPKLWPALALAALLAAVAGGCSEPGPDSEKPAQTGQPTAESRLTAEAVERCYGPARKWLVSNVGPDGLFRYRYDPRTDRYADKNNAVRQLMASRLLAELAREDPSLVELHARNLDYVFSHWYREEEEIGYIYFANKSKLGANAMALQTLVCSPLLERYRRQAKRLADGILLLIHEDGRMEPWLKEPPYRYDKERLLYYYSGEALLSLLDYAARTGEDKYLEAARRAQDYYLRRYVDELDKHYYPAYVPWHTQSLGRLYKLTGRQRYARAVFRLNDKLLEILDRRDEKGRFYNPKFPQYGAPHTASDAVYTEGLAYAYETAILADDAPHQKRYRRALVLALGNLERLQYDENSAGRFARPDRLIGAMRSSATDPHVRIDCVQHAMDAWRKLLEIPGFVSKHTGKADP